MPTFPNRPRPTWIRAAAIVAALAVALPAAAADAAAPVALRISSMHGESAVPGKEARTIGEKVERAVAEDFLRRHPGVRLAAHTGLMLSGSSAEAGVTLAMAGGTAGDILYVNFRTLDQFVQQDYLAPLDDYLVALAREHRGLPADASLAFADIGPDDVGVHPVIWGVICRRGRDGRKHVYCFPKTTAVMALHYRKDLFRAAGLDPERPPRTWQELFDDCQRLADPVAGVYGFGMDNIGWHFVDFLWQGGSEVVVEDDAGVWRAKFNDDAAVGTLRFLRRLANTEKTAVDPATRLPVTGPIAKIESVDDVYTDFAQRRSAMMFNYTDELLLAHAEIQPEVIGLAPLPAGPGGSANEINAAMWGISSQVADRAVRDAAWAYIRYQASDDARRIATDTYIQAGYANLVNPALLVKFGYDRYLDSVPAAWREANVEAYRNGRPEPNGRNCQHIYAELFAPLDLVLHDRAVKQKAALVPGTPAYDEDARWLRGLLDHAVDKTDRKLLGLIPPEQLRRQRRWAWVALAAVAGAFLAAGWRFMRSFEVAPPAAGATSSRLGPRHHLRAWAFLIVAILSIAVWAYWPLLQGSVMAFQDYRVLGGSDWVGLDNFIQAWNEDDFWIGLRVTFLYVVLSLGTGFLAPIILAIMLHEIPRGKVLFRVLYYLPAVISGLITMFLWRSFFDPTAHGMLNQLLAPLGAWSPRAMLLALAAFALVIIAGGWQSLHEALRRRAPSPASVAVVTAACALLGAWWGWDWIAAMWDKRPPFGWLQDPDTALLCVIVPGIWAGAGPGCLIYLAALKAIPEELYEAAELDGAGTFRKAAHIALPSLKPLIIINFVSAFIGAFHAMQNIFVMSGSGPLKSTHALSIEIWMAAFLHSKYGYATAIAWILGAMLIGFTVWQLKILKDMRFAAGK